MSDATHEAPERIWIWGWRADSVWQEQTWQHEDEPMSTMEYVRADLFSALTEQLAAARRDAEEAEAYAGELEGQLAKAVGAGVSVAASLNAAISLLERGGKKAAASNKMFAQMLVDYTASLDRFRTAIAELMGETK